MLKHDGGGGDKQRNPRSKKVGVTYPQCTILLQICRIIPMEKKSHAAHLYSKPDYSGRETEHTETHAIKSFVDFSM